MSILATFRFQEKKQDVEVGVYFQLKQNKHIQDYVSCLCSESVSVENDRHR